VWARRAAHGRMEGKLMPDFDTRKPQESNEPRRHRIALIVGPLHSLSRASKRRILLMARGLRDSLMANRPRTLLIGGVFLCVMVAVPVGLLTYSSSELDYAQQTGIQQDIRIDETQKGRLVLQLSGIYSNTLQYAISGMDANGSSLERLTDTVDKRSMGYSNEDPSRSPDLKKIAFTRVVSEFPASVDASASASARAGPSYIQVPYVFVMNADGSDEIQLGDMAAAKPDWSPDGKQIVFSSDENWTSSGGTDEGDCDLYVTSVDGSGTPRKLTNGPGCESNPSWSPDGTKIAFTRDADGDLDIYVIDACCEEGDTNEPQQLTDDDLDDTDPSWSPDGTKIAFTRSVRDTETNIVTNDPVKPPEADVYKMDADGSGQTRLTYSKATEAQPTWSPDGTKIAFTRQGFPGASPQTDPVNATTGIFMMDSDGTDPALVRIFVNEIASFPEWAVTSQQDGVTKQTDENQPTEEAIADWRALDARLPDVAVQAYIEEINGLLEGVNLHDNVVSVEENQAMYMVSSVLTGLDTSGQEEIVRFLARAGLLPGIPINYLDLRGIDLSGANLSGAQWSSDNLSGANLSNANLSRASLYDVNLSDADLGGANLSGSNLGSARLLSAKVTGAQLLQAESLSGATMPDGTQHPY
jgi:Tol biopolymer transport system component